VADEEEIIYKENEGMTAVGNSDGSTEVRKEGRKLEVSWNSTNSLPTNLWGNSVGRLNRTSI
jgi:hypothetical protein